MAPTWSQVMEYALDKAGALPDLTALTCPRWLLALGTCQLEEGKVQPAGVWSSVRAKGRRLTDAVRICADRRRYPTKASFRSNAVVRMKPMAAVARLVS